MIKKELIALKQMCKEAGELPPYVEMLTPHEDDHDRRIHYLVSVPRAVETRWRDYWCPVQMTHAKESASEDSASDSSVNRWTRIGCNAIRTYEPDARS